MGRVKGLHPGSSKDVVKCPVDSCSKVKVRRDNWVKHIQTVGTSKTQAKKKAFKVIYERIRHEGLAGDLRVLPSGGFQLSQAKKRKSCGAKKRRTEKFIKKYNIKTVKCQVCGYPSNFKNNQTCRECQAPLEGESITAVYLDTERAEGRANSDPIQLGLIKYCLQCWSRSWHLDQQIKIKHLDGSED